MPVKKKRKKAAITANMHEEIAAGTKRNKATVDKPKKKR